MQTGKNRKRKR